MCADRFCDGTALNAFRATIVALTLTLLLARLLLGKARYDPGDALAEGDWPNVPRACRKGCGCRGSHGEGDRA